jgi:formylglycine-generating enzyme required for sulfatase activity
MEWAHVERTDGGYRPKSGYEHKPVVNVTWYGAKAYCEWAGKHLPTEAQWEKAARGPDARTYPWGKDIDCDHANYAECVSGSTEVGSYDNGKSPYGALDMAGNVWEWAADWYDKDHYKIPAVRNPQGPKSGNYRVLRGGSTALDAVHARAANRGWRDPDGSSGDMGFRCAAPAAAVTPTPTPTSKAGTTQTPKVDDAVMVHVPAGEFWMGSTDEDIGAIMAECDGCDRERFTDEQPQHKVHVDAFWIDRTEVTNARYQKCVDAGACTPPSSSESDKEPNYYGNPAYDDYPVIWVNWTQADAYCRWAGKRLPTEAEWEKAARGDDKRKYPWGKEDIDCDRANFWDEQGACVHDTAKVGSYPAGASFYGALDMAGSVWEWVADWYDENYYQVSPERNPRGPGPGKARVMRGGSWINSWGNARAANRERGAVDHSTRHIGFRCAQSVP